MKCLLCCLSAVLIASLLFVTALASEDASDKIETCGDERYSECEKKYVPDETKIYVPDNEKDLDAVCATYLPYGECSKQVDINCDGPLPKWKEDFAAFVVEICKKSSSLHKSAVENLACLQREWLNHKIDPSSIDIVGSHVCFLKEPKVVKIIENYLTSGGEKKLDVEKWVLNCPARYIKTACFLKSFETCGSALTNVIIETFEKFDFWEKNSETEDSCPRDRTVKAVEKIKDLKLDLDLENLLNYALLITDKK